MTYSILEISALAGLQSFIEVSQDFPAKTTAHYYFAEEEPPEKSAQKYKKRFQIHEPLENITVDLCTKHNHPQYTYPVVYHLAGGLINAMVSHLSGRQVVKDVEERNETSDTYLAFKMSQMNFLLNINPHSRTDAILMRTSTAETIKRQQEAAKNVFMANNTQMTEEEYKAFVAVAEVADIKKGFFTNLIILPTIKPDLPDWLSPPLK